jgi:hypothetical protein
MYSYLYVFENTSLFDEMLFIYIYIYICLCVFVNYVFIV